MDKPLNLLIEEGAEKIIKAVNETKLPPYLLEPILKDVYNEILKLKQEENRKSKLEWEKSQKGEDNG